MNTIGYIMTVNQNIGYLEDEFGRCLKESVNLMDKWNYIKLVSKFSDNYGNELINMMEKYNKTNLQQITYEEAKKYYEQLNKNDYVL